MLRELPSEIEEVFEKALVAEFTVIDEDGVPVTHPSLPLYDKEDGKIYVTSSLLFSKKLEHIKRNPKVSLCFSNRGGLQVDPYRVVLVKGDARVDEEDVHHGWERLLPLWRRKEPYINALVAQRYALPLFWDRAVIEMEPTKVYFWPSGRVDERPEVYGGKGT